ncbi:Kh domain-containing protein [Thalictrum thalictroides]|uniref:Kh domain-containing protein n=1 Tax=Thalictrum thalictroides TaxID=46969 RepID=A0A7J6V5I7_THATH|nr:Kh domain-containing protein [Thalictrum thalictroides]
MMGDRIPPGSYFQYSPSGLHGRASPHRPPSSPSLDRESNGRYLAELLAERQKLGPFMQILPLCTRLLNQEIMRASGLVPNPSFVDHDRIEHESPLRSTAQHSNGGLMDLEGWSVMQAEENGFLQRIGALQTHSMGWRGPPGVQSNPVLKKVIRLDVPVDKFPNFNFVGRLLGPRGNSLKRVEATTQCRVYIRGRGSVKDSIKEEKLRDKPGYEHLNEQLHVLVEAEFPADVIESRLNQAVAILEDLLKPVDESFDYYKKQQLRELAIINGTLREESPHMSPSMSPSPSPFNTTGMKRAKTGL